MKYIVTIAGRTLEVEVDGDQVTVDGRTVTATLSALPGTPLRHLQVDGRPVALAVESAGKGSWGLTLRRRALGRRGHGRAHPTHPQPHRRR